MQIGENGSENFEQFDVSKFNSIDLDGAVNQLLPQIEAAIGGIEQNSGNSEG